MLNWQVVQVKQLSSEKLATPHRIHQFWGTFEPRYLWSVFSKSTVFFSDLLKKNKPQQLVSETMMKLFSFLSYLRFKISEK